MVYFELYINEQQDHIIDQTLYFISLFNYFIELKYIYYVYILQLFIYELKCLKGVLLCNQIKVYILNAIHILMKITYAFLIQTVSFPSLQYKSFILLD